MKRDKGYRSTPRDLIRELRKLPQDVGIEFDTSNRRELYLLSVYQSDDGKIHIDVGDADE